MHAGGEIYGHMHAQTHTHTHATGENVKLATSTCTYRHIVVAAVVSCCFSLRQFSVYAAAAYAFADRALSGMFFGKTDRTAGDLLERALSLLHMYRLDTTLL